MRELARGVDTCLAVTADDGVVVARSAFESSIHYRSAVLFGRCAVLAPDEQERALDVITEALIPGRVAETAADHGWRELVGDPRCSCRFRSLGRWSPPRSHGSSWPEDDEDDVAGDAWAGVVPRCPELRRCRARHQTCARVSRLPESVGAPTSDLVDQPPTARGSADRRSAVRRVGSCAPANHGFRAHHAEPRDGREQVFGLGIRTNRCGSPSPRWRWRSADRAESDSNEPACTTNSSESRARTDFERDGQCPAYVRRSRRTAFIHSAIASSEESVGDEFVDTVTERLHLVAVDRLVERITGRKVPVESADTDLGALGDVFQRHVDPALGEELDLQQPRAAPLDCGCASARGARAVRTMSDPSD